MTYAQGSNDRNGVVCGRLRWKAGIADSCPARHAAAMNKLILASLVVGGAAVLVACVSYREREPPLVVNVKGDGDGCHVSVDSRRVTIDDLLDVARNSGSRRAIVVYAKDTPYRCIGASIFTLQRGGVRSVDAAMWDGAYD